MSHVRRRMLVAGAVLALSLTGCGGATPTDDSGKPLEQIKVGIPTTDISVGQMAYSSLPIETGYAKDEGIDWKPVGLAGSAPVLQAIQAGAVDVGLAGTESVAAAIVGGLDAKIAYMVITGNVQIPYVLETSDIDDFKDFEGKSVGVLDLGAALVEVIKGSVQAAGGDPDKVTFVKVGPGAESLVAMQENRIQVLAVPDNFSAQVAALGAKMRPILDDRFRALGATQGIIFPQKMIDENPDLVVRIARTVAKSTLFGSLNPEAAVKMHWKQYPEAKPAGADEATELKLQTTIGKARLDAMQQVNGRWGDTTDDQLEARLATVYAAGTATKDNLPLSRIWTNALLDQINQFDESAVETDATAGGPQ
jgi:NitT/TauT family transport system substrate-binding protein